MQYSKFRDNMSRKKKGEEKSERPEGSKKSFGETKENNRTRNILTKSIPLPKNEKPEPCQKDLENGCFNFGGFLKTFLRSKNLENFNYGAHLELHRFWLK